VGAILIAVDKLDGGLLLRGRGAEIPAIAETYGVRNAMRELVVAVIRFESGQELAWIARPDQAAVIVLADVGEPGRTGRSFYNLTTNESLYVTAEDLKKPDAELHSRVHAFLGFGDALACERPLTGSTTLFPEALDPICYDDCMRGAQATCAGSCTLALLAGGPPAYIACFGACMSVWHATCLIGCDTRTM